MTPPLTRRQATMEELRSTLQQTRQANAALLAQNQELLARLENQAPPQPEPRPMDPRPTLPLPTRFTGTVSECSNFITKIQLLFALYPRVYPTAALKSGLLISLLDGAAADWAARELRENPELIHDYDNLIQRFTNAFDDHERRFKSQHRLMSLRQGSRSVATYSQEFRSLALHTQWDTAALLAHYIQGLRDDIQDLLICLTDPTSIDEAIAKATACEVRIHSRARNRATTGSNGYTLGNQRQPPTQPRGPLTQEEKDRRRANNLCAYCGDASHLRANCPRTPQRPGPNNPAPAAGRGPLRLAAVAVPAESEDQGNGPAQGQ